MTSATDVPPRARTRSWLTLEENKQFFVWHDPEGNPPPEEVVIPRLEGYSPTPGPTGPVQERLRRTHRHPEQFYVDVADVDDDMTQRFEFEVDTARANEAWEAEVAQNLARAEGN